MKATAKSEYTDPKNYERLYEVMQYKNVLAMRVALETGLRIDDVLSLRAENMEGNKITYKAKKTGKSGKKKITKELAKRLGDICGGEGYIFKGKKTNTHRTRQAVWKDIKRAVERVGLQGQISPHSARKTYAVELRKREGVKRVQEELQHSRGDVTMIYAFADMVYKDTGKEVDYEMLAELIADKVVSKLGQKGNNKPVAKKKKL